MQEEFRDVIGYEGFYQVSNLGNVRSLKFGKQRILSEGKQNKYLQVCLCKDGIRKNRTIHQLVAESFLGHKPCGYTLVVDHINNNKKDNRLKNLQLITTRNNAYKTQGNYSSKYKGVHWNKESKKWKVQICINNKIKHLGYFTNELEASKAYNNKLKEL